MKNKFTLVLIFVLASLLQCHGQPITVQETTIIISNVTYTVNIHESITTEFSNYANDTIDTFLYLEDNVVDCIDMKECSIQFSDMDDLVGDLVYTIQNKHPHNVEVTYKLIKDPYFYDTTSGTVLYLLLVVTFIVILLCFRKPIGNGCAVCCESCFNCWSTIFKSIGSSCYRCYDGIRYRIYRRNQQKLFNNFEMNKNNDKLYNEL